MSGIAPQPIPLDELVELLRPQHPSEALTHDLLQIVADRSIDESCVELVRLLTSFLNDVIEYTLILDGRVLLRLQRSELQAYDGTSASRRNVAEDIVRCSLRSFLLRIDERG